MGNSDGRPLPGDAENSVHMQRLQVLLPAETAWPLGLACGASLLLTGLVTNSMVSLLGLVLTVVSAIGWFRQVLPHERHETIDAVAEIVPVETHHLQVTRIKMDETHRAMLPLETYPFSSGLKGGFAGGTAMIVLAEIFSVAKYHSIWYVVNLLGGAGVAIWTHPTEHQIASFNLTATLIAIAIHTASSFLVGLLYGALLPIMPKHPILLGGLLGPALWTGMLHSVLGVVNPFFDTHINWWWFALSQVGFGLVAGYTVAHLGRFKRLQEVPLSVRLGVETPGHMHEHGPGSSGR